MRILVAEDDPALGSFVRKGLEAEHYAVDVSADGEQARAMAGGSGFCPACSGFKFPPPHWGVVFPFFSCPWPPLAAWFLTGGTWCGAPGRVPCLGARASF